MAYFTNPRTEEELKEQYRKLLIRYDYRNSKNEKLIAEIRKEYEQKLKQIRYDSGYRTTAQKIKESVTSYLAQQSAEYEQEEDRKRALRNKPYTKQDLLNLIEEQKRFINDTVYQILKEQSSGYTNLKEIVMNAVRGKEIYDVYSGIGLASLSPAKLNADCKDLREMVKMKERMEYCVLSLAGRNEKQMEIMLSQVEDQLGNCVKQVFQQYEKKVVDPIVEMEALKQAREKTKQRRVERATTKPLEVLFLLLLSSPGVVAIIIGLIGIFEGGIVVAVLGTVWVLFVRFLYKTNVKIK